MNVQKYYEIKKKSSIKEEKTKQKADEAIKQAEINAAKQLEQVKTQTRRFDKVRKPFWFEKYDWFISSENYLVISGRNAQQNEQIVKDHLNKRDIYVHADLPGAASTVIINPSTLDISPITLNEAGVWAVTHSKAWADSKLFPAFWVWGS